jgi:Iap family predicted aminopeptidase
MSKNTVTKLNDQEGKVLVEESKQEIKDRQAALTKLGAKSFEGVVVVDNQARSFING